MDRRAVQAFVVVLDDDLPVGSDVIGDPSTEAQLTHSVPVEIGDRLVAVAQPLVERPWLVGQAHEQETRVLPHPDAVQRVVRALELLVLVDVRRGEQAAVEVVRPCVVRALERLAEMAARGLVVEQLRAAVGAHVVEGAQLAVAVAHDEDRLADDVADEVVARPGDLLASADAHPAAEEQALALLLVDLGGRVVRAGERRLRPPGMDVANARALLGDHGRQLRVRVSGRTSARAREAEVDLRLARVRPARRHDLAPCVELDALRPVHVQVAEQRALPAAE